FPGSRAVPLGGVPWWREWRHDVTASGKMRAFAVPAKVLLTGPWPAAAPGPGPVMTMAALGATPLRGEAEPGKPARECPARFMTRAAPDRRFTARDPACGVREGRGGMHEPAR